MSFTDNFNAALEKELKKQNEKNLKKKKKSKTDSFTDRYLAEEAKLIANDPDIAPVGTSKVNAMNRVYQTSQASNQRDKSKDDLFGLDFVQKGAFEDGYDFGDVSNSILMTVNDIGTGVVKGAAKMAGGILDAGTYGAAAIADRMGNEKAADKMRKFAQKNVIDDAFAPWDEQVNKYSLLGKTSDSIAEGLGQVGAIILTGGAAGAAGLGTVGASLVTTGAMGVSSFGSGMTEAYEGGATDEEAATYGLIKGAVDAGSELLFGGLGKVVNVVGVSKGLGGIDDMLAKKLTDKITNQLTKNFVQFGIKASGEGLEEVLAEVGTAMAKSATYMSDKDWKELVSSEDLLEQFVVGAVTSGISQSGIVPGMSQGSLKEANQTGRDFISGLNATEQKVIDKEVENRIADEEKGGKVSNKRKNEIYEEVIRDMDRGRISVDTIEEVLGGESYKSYKDTVDSEDALRQEFDTLNKMKQGDMTGEQIDRRAELKQQLEDIKKNSKRDQLKSQLGEEVFGLAKDSRLVESYFERSRKGQAFKADLSKYDAKQQETIKRAIDSGILNNTNRTHEFVDLIAKISADKGVTFDFTNNEKLKESGFALDGVTVNGYVSNGGVTLNIDSAKALESTVGHEITHILEGTELYTALQTAVTEYAKTKGDYQGRLDAITKLYEGVEGADVNAELTADLVGDYIFADPDFVRNLSVNHRNVFQKIYDEIKYLCKIATAGSKEARDLEKVKRSFEQAYRESGKASNDTKYSVSDENIKDTSTGYGYGETYFTMSYTQDGKVVGTLEYGEYDGKPNVKMIEVDPEYRRQGIGRKLMQELQKKYPETEIDFGMSTPDGTKLLDSITYDVVDEAVAADIQRLKDLQAELNELQEKLDVLYDTDLLTAEQGAELDKLGDRWQEVYETIRELDRSLRGKKASRTFVKTDTKYSLSDPETERYIAKSTKKYGDVERAAVEHFGTTDNYRTAGYILRDGKMLDFSGAHWLDGESDSYIADWKKKNDIRQVDHEDIFEAFEISADDFPSDSRKEFINRGNIRVSPEAPGINIAAEPTAEQYQAIRNLIKSNPYEAQGFYVDIEDKAKRVDKIVYSGNVNADRVVNDIKYFYKNGAVREQSAISQFRYSLSDSSGRQLSESQIEYFKDSKVRDDNGSLKLVYHGSGAEFTEFSYDFMSSHGSSEGQGFYFTDSENMAKGYQQNGTKLLKGYLDIKKPLSDSEVTIKRNELTKLLKAIDPTGDDVIINYDPSGGRGYPSKEWYNRALAGTVDSMFRYNESDSEILADIANSGAGTEAVVRKARDLLGYDGYIVSGKYDDATVYVAFESNQFKNADNLNPTSDPDIRKSLSEEGEVPVRNGRGTLGSDIAYVPNEVAPVETVQETAADIFPDDIGTANDDEPAEMGETPIKTVKERFSEKVSNSKAELAKVQSLRDNAAKSYDDKIAKAQAEYDAKKNKDTKVANNLLLRIERLQRLKADVDAQFAKRISGIESRIAKSEAEVHEGHKAQDRYEKTVNRIDQMLEYDKSELAKEYEAKKQALEDKNAYISNKATELYQEIRNLKKGVKASEQLGYLLDHGYDWSSIKSALINIKHTPDRLVSQVSEAESVAREMLNEDYENSLLNLDSDYQKQIEELESAADEKRKSARVANQRRIKQDEHAKWAAELAGDTSTWVDKKLGLSYKVNTLRRNLRDVVRDADGNRDVARADAIDDALSGSYNHNHASLNREANRIKDPYAEMNITKAEDAYIQMLGEFRHNPDTTLTEDKVKEFLEANKNKIDEAKVDKIIDMARETYDTLLERVNEVLIEQGMKEIPYRKGYFPHFTEEKQSFVAKLFNWKTQNNDIPTSIAGITEMFNPERSYQSFNKRRNSDITDYSFTKGLDGYVQGALDWIYHIEDIQKRRAFENHLRYIHSDEGVQKRIDEIKNNTEYDADEAQEQIDLVFREANNPLNNFVTDLRAGTNRLANKKSSLDRGMEEMVNRKVYSTLTNLSNRVSANMVAGSVSSALTNFIPITQSWGEVSPVSSLRAMGDTIRSTFRDDGMVEKSDFLTNRLRQAENLYKTNWDKASEKIGILMEVVDSFTSQTVWRSKYLENISNGMSEADAIKNADRFAEGVMAGRSKGNMPTIFESKNPLIKTLTAFQLEVSNQYGYMLKDMPQNVESRGKLVKGYATMFLGAYAYNALYSMLTGRDAAFDPIGIIEELLRDMGLFGDDEEEEPADIVMNLADNILEETPFVGGLLGGGRIPISSALPYDGLYEAVSGTLQDISDKDWAGLTKEWLNPVYYLAMPMAGGQIRKTVQGLSMFSDEHPVAGSYTDSGNLRFPVEDTLGNRVKAAIFGQYASKNARDYFDGGYAPLKEKQIQEFIDVDMPIRDYWDYREGLADQETLEDKFDYIAGLDLPVEKKNILINNIVDRKEDVDLANYDDFSTYEEFDFATKNAEKYDFLQANGISYATYNASEESRDAYTWAYNNPEKYTLSKAVASDVVEYRRYTGELYDIKADKDSNGKSINGSRKKKVVEYLNGLDIDYGERLILFKKEYESDDTYNYDIIEYLNNREDISYDEMVTILKELGFTVTSDGRVQW